MGNQNQNKKTTWIIQLAVIIVLIGILVIFNGNTKVKGTNGGCCATSNYKVTLSFTPPTNPPTVNCNDIEQWAYCTDSRHPTLKWTYSDPDGDPQSAYQIQADNNSDFSSPEEDTDWVSSAGTEYATRGDFAWDTTYYWRIRVRDSGGATSSWCSPKCSFETSLHAYPSPDFSKYPDVPIAGEPVQFVDNTTYYGESYGTAWSWTFQDGTPATSAQANPKVAFQNLGTKSVSLTATDSDTYSCSCTKSVGIGLPIPKWKEIKPW